MKALVCYTGDLVRYGSRQVSQAFIDSQFKEMSSRRKACGKSMTGSSASSVKSGHSGQGNSLEYLKAIMTNVFTVCGYKHFIKYIAREGKSKLSLQKVTKQLQQTFSPEEWYYLRKIHKKDRNYFLNKGG